MATAGHEEHAGGVAASQARDIPEESAMEEDVPTRHDAEDRLEALAQAGDTLHDYLVGLAALVARGAGDQVDVLHALDELTTAHRSTRRAHEHLISAMADQAVRLGDPLGGAEVAPDI